MQLIDKTEILPGMPFEVYKNNLEELKINLKKKSQRILKQTKRNYNKSRLSWKFGSLVNFTKENKIPVVKQE